MSLKSPGTGNAVQNGAAATIGGTAPTVAAGQIGFGGVTSGTATAGSGGAVPATVQAYLIVNVAGTNFKVPYFAV